MYRGGHQAVVRETKASYVMVGYVKFENTSNYRVQLLGSKECILAVVVGIKLHLPLPV